MRNNIPFDNIQDEEFQKSFYSFCTFVSLMHDKKMNFATIFLKILENKALRDIFVSIIDEENDFNAIKKYVITEPSITKSKYVTKFLNKFDGLNDSF
jgi:transcription elongation factor GreA-like protein